MIDSNNKPNKVVFSMPDGTKNNMTVFVRNVLYENGKIELEFMPDCTSTVDRFVSTLIQQQTNAFKDNVQIAPYKFSLEINDDEFSGAFLTETKFNDPDGVTSCVQQIDLVFIYEQ